MLNRIDRSEIQGLAAELGFFSLAAEDLAQYGELFDALLDGVDAVDREPPPEAPKVAARRDAGRRPMPGEDPFNAIVRWCSVKADAEGVLTGMRVAIKDAVAVAGVPMTCGSRLMGGYVPAADSVIAERVLEAGGEIVAVTNMDYFACAPSGETSAYGPTLNPFDAARTAGGSSGGSAAGLYYDGIDVAIGTDQAGSIRVPASWSGVIGLKPTHGLVPYAGVVSQDQAFDHAGPMGRTVREVAALLDAIGGGRHLAAVEGAPDDLSGIRIGVLREGFDPDVEPETRQAAEEAIERITGLGAERVEISLPEHRVAGPVLFTLFVESNTNQLTAGGHGYQASEGYAVDLAVALGCGLRDSGDELSPQVKLYMLLGHYLRTRYHGSMYAKAHQMRQRLTVAQDRVFEDVDFLVMPTTPHRAHTLAPDASLSEFVRRGWTMLTNTVMADVTGHPALSIPAAQADGLPVGLMLVGRRAAEPSLLAMAQTYESQYGWLPGDPPATR